MGFFDLILHLFGFAAPALALGLLMPLAGRFILPQGPALPRYRVQAAACAVAALAALAGGLWFFGRDGKIASYTALVLAVATAQWLIARGWRR